MRKRRAERAERSFAHLYETGGMRRTHLRQSSNILKRLLVHGCGYNLGLIMQKLFRVGTPRGWAALKRLRELRTCLKSLWGCLEDLPKLTWPRLMVFRNRSQLLEAF